jgi:hypothetical protein
LALTLPSVAEMFVLPAASVVASPWLPGVLLMVATVAASDVQLTDVVMFWVEPSVYRPVAVYCCVPPATTSALPGEMTMEASAAALTVIVAAGEEIALWVALMELVPLASAVARPLDPGALLIEATEALLDDQLTCVVTSCVLPSV